MTKTIDQGATMPTHLFCPEAHFVDYRITGLSARNLAAAYHPHPELPDAE